MLRLGSALICTLALSGSVAMAARPPLALVALVDSGTVSSPIVGLRCTGLLLSDSIVITAEHCLDDEGLSVVQTDSLCEATGLSRPLPRSEGASEAAHDFVAIDMASGGHAHPPLAPPTSGPAVVWGYGVVSTLGRVGCAPGTYRGTLASCPGRAGQWCLETTDEQLCGGSSGAPVYREVNGGLTMIGVVSRGPACGRSGPVVIAIP